MNVVAVPLRMALGAVEVGEGHAQVFGLSAHVGAHADVAVGGTGPGGVDGQPEGRLVSAAVGAEAAGHIERQHDPVALAHAGHPGSDLFHVDSVWLLVHHCLHARITHSWRPRLFPLLAP